jgi:hypothetical protein
MVVSDPTPWVLSTVNTLPLPRAPSGCQRFQRTVGDAAARVDQAQPGRTADHAVGDAGGGQRAVVGRVSAVSSSISRSLSPAALPVDRQQRIDRVQVAVGVGVGLAEAAERGVAADVDRVVAGSGVQRGPIACIVRTAKRSSPPRLLISTASTPWCSTRMASNRLVWPVRNSRSWMVAVALPSVPVAVSRKSGRRLLAAGHHQPVGAIGTGGVDDDHGVALGRHRDQVVLGLGLSLAALSSVARAAPVEHGHRGVADTDAAVQVVDHEGVVAGATGDLGDARTGCSGLPGWRRRQSGRRHR